MKKIMTVLIFLSLISAVVFAEDLSVEEKQIIKDRITANDPGRDLLLDRLLRETNGAEINFALPYINDQRADVRAVVAEKLGFYGEASVAVPALLKAREDENWVVRMRVARALLQRGKEKEAVPVLLNLISEKQVYYELIMDLYKMSSKEAKEETRKGIINIKNNESSPLLIKAYCTVILAYVYNEQFTQSNKELIIQAIKESDKSTDRRDENVAYRLVQNVGPNKGNPSITKEDYMEILKTAQLSTHENIAEEASRLLNWFEQGK